MTDNYSIEPDGRIRLKGRNLKTMKIKQLKWRRTREPNELPVITTKEEGFQAKITELPGTLRLLQVTWMDDDEGEPIKGLYTQIYCAQQAAQRIYEMNMRTSIRTRKLGWFKSEPRKTCAKMGDYTFTITKEKDFHQNTEFVLEIKNQNLVNIRGLKTKKRAKRSAQQTVERIASYYTETKSQPNRPGRPASGGLG